MLGGELNLNKILIDKKILQCVVYATSYFENYEEVYDEVHVELVNALFWVLFDRSRYAG